MSLLKTFVVDLAEATDDIDERVEQNEEAEKTLHEKVEDRYGEQADEEGTHAWDLAADDYYEKYVRLREQRAELEARRERIAEMLDDPDQAAGWSHYEFTFEEPSTEDAMFIQGRSSAMAEEAEERGTKIDGRAFGITEFLERVCVDRPPEAPANLADGLPNYVGQWMLDVVDEETMVGVDEELGNTSPREAAESLNS